MGDIFTRVETTAAPVRQQVANMLRSAIIAGRFEPGQRLVEKDLCERLGVSRPSVREALRELEAEGLIRNVPNRGPVVARVSLEEAASIYEVRGMLEGLAARRFAERATPEQVAAFEAAIDMLDAAYRIGDVDGILVAKAQFYRTLFEGSGNTIIPPILRTMHARINFLRHVSLSDPDRLPRSMAEIRAILEAVKRRDADAAFAASMLHVQEAAKTALAALEAHVGTAERAAVGR